MPVPASKYYEYGDGAVISYTPKMCVPPSFNANRMVPETPVAVLPIESPDLAVDDREIIPLIDQYLDAVRSAKCEALSAPAESLEHWIDEIIRVSSLYAGFIHHSFNDGENDLDVYVCGRKSQGMEEYAEKIALDHREWMRNGGQGFTMTFIDGGTSEAFQPVYRDAGHSGSRRLYEQMSSNGVLS